MPNVSRIISIELSVLNITTYNFSIEKWPLYILIGSLNSYSEAIVTAQTALSSNCCFSQKMAENQTEVNYLCKLNS
jgi:hypothetical protein